MIVLQEADVEMRFIAAIIGGSSVNVGWCCRCQARVICNESARTIDVKWTKDRGFKEPVDRALELLQSGKIAEAIPLLW